MITRNFNLFLNAGKHIPLVINVNQYDHDEQWCFTLLNDNGEKYIPSTGAIVGIKADRLGIINSGTVNASGQVVINETEQMTAAVGKAVFELLIDDQTHGTANFAVLVEPKPGNNADFSESDLSLLQEAIDGTSAAAIAQGVSDWMDDNLTPTTPVVDSSLTVQGAAADAKKVGDEINDLKSQIDQSSGLTDEIKQALMDIANHVSWDESDPTGQTYISALQTALYPITGISAVFNPGSNVIYSNATLDSLKQYLTVTALYSDSAPEVIEDYTLSGTITIATTCTITVNYGVYSTTFDVEVSPMLYNWDLTDSLVDTIRGFSLTTFSGSGYSEPSITPAGLVFDQPTQELGLANNMSYAGRTIEIDVAEFNFAGNSSYHVRFLMNASSNASNAIGAGALIFRSGYGWTSYGFSDSNDSHTASNYRKWSANGWGSLYASDKVNAFDGKTVKIVYGSDGHTRKLYLDNELIATMTDIYFNHDSTLVRIGGMGSFSQANGDQCYNMTITGIRVYSGEV